jgi:hypothetical protein
MFNSYRFHKRIILLFLVPTMRADHSLPKTLNLLTFSLALVTITSHTFSDKSHIRFRKLDQSTESASQILAFIRQFYYLILADSIRVSYWLYAAIPRAVLAYSNSAV